MMKLGKNKTLAAVIVTIVIFGLVLAYVPLIFLPQISPQGTEYPAETEQTASLLPLPEDASSTELDEISENLTADSFENLGEEEKALNDLDLLLENQILTEE